MARQPLAQVVRVQQFADADAAAAADLVLVARADAAAGGADVRAPVCSVSRLLLDVVGEDDVGVVAERRGCSPTSMPPARELVHLLEEPRRVDDDAVADDRRDGGLRTPVGSRESLNVLPSRRRCGRRWPRRCSGRRSRAPSASRSTILPLASSPHWRPTTHVQLIPRPRKSPGQRPGRLRPNRSVGQPSEPPMPSKGRLLQHEVHLLPAALHIDTRATWWTWRTVPAASARSPSRRR